jgi:hypothetical protein
VCGHAASGFFKSGVRSWPCISQGSSSPAKLKEGRRDVSTADGRAADFALRQGAGHGDDERAADVRIVWRELGAEAVLSPGVTLIGGENDECVRELAALLQGGEHLADAFIQRPHGLMILARPLGQRAATITVKVIAHLAADGFVAEHRLAIRAAFPGGDLLHVTGLALTRWIDVGWCGDFGIGVVVEMAFRWLYGACTPP